MAKVRLVKAKTSITKRNVRRMIITSLVIIDTLAVIFILLNLYGVLDLI